MGPAFCITAFANPACLPYGRVMRFSIAMLLMCLSACTASSTSDDDDDRGRSGSSVSAAIAAYSDALCAAVFRCGAALMSFRFENEAACQVAYRRDFADQYGGAGSPGVARMEACVQELEQADCVEVMTTDVSDCSPLVGTLPPGTTCRSPGACASGWCQNLTTAECGVCGVSGGVGADCTSNPCNLDLTCTVNKTCASRVALGAVCGTNQPCQTGAYCSDGRCVALKGNGTACTTSQECSVYQALSCFQGNCSTVGLANPGGTCGSSINTLCRNNGFCRGATTTVTGVCVAAATEGQACSTTNGPSCVEPLSCSNSGTCAFLAGPTVCN